MYEGIEAALRLWLWMGAVAAYAANLYLKGVAYGEVGIPRDDKVSFAGSNRRGPGTSPRARRALRLSFVLRLVALACFVLATALTASPGIVARGWEWFIRLRL